MARVRAVSTARYRPLDAGWTFLETRAGAAASPEAALALTGDWQPAEVPGTAASSLRTLGRYAEGDTKAFDAFDYWYRVRIAEASSGERTVLHFDGLATIADVWLDGEHLLRSESMWESHAIDVTGRLREGSEIVIRFGSLEAFLAGKKPRPRYKTRLVRRQELRLVRTTLLGRMPGWSPQGAPVGPFRSVWLEVGGPETRASLKTSVIGSDGVLEASLLIRGDVASAELRVGPTRVPFALDPRPGACHLRAEARIEAVETWWPHTHGARALYDTGVAAVVDGRDVEIDLGRVGFRSLTVDRSPEGRGFGVVLNGVPIFARGATFTPLDTLSLGATEAAYRTALLQVRRAGMNMIRLSGTLVYEDEVLYDICDELGIMVWQDFMFANMDYPSSKEFFACAEREAEAVLDRIETSAALTVIAGGSEVAQQASMLGLDRDAWQPELFERVLADASARLRPDVPYLPSTPWGGALPFRSNEGVSHYYGVGAYLRPLEDARRAEVRFASECLAFSNVPSQRSVDTLLAGGESPAHPRWKERVPRDHGAGWDFEDVRDHYVSQLFGVDPTRVRHLDPERYLALGRAATGEVMASVFSEWRRAGSTCRGGLVWLLRDLWLGAGFGVVDSTGTPKSCYFALARVLQPVALLAIDEGLNGARLVATNESATPIEARLDVALYLRSTEVRRASRELVVPPRGQVDVDVEELLGSFSDPTHAYRFGPPVSDVVVGRLLGGGPSEVISTAFLFPIGYESEIDPNLEIEASATPDANGDWMVTVTARRLALFVGLDVRGYAADDEAFHIEPGGSRTVRLTPCGDVKAVPSGTVRALNAGRDARIRFNEEARG